jgi:DNA replication protein DnaC
MSSQPENKQTGLENVDIDGDADINISQEIHYEPNKLAEKIGIVAQPYSTVNIGILKVANSNYTEQDKNRLEIARTEKLEEMYQESITCCKARFRAVIGDKQKAAELANDFSLGLPPANLDLKAYGLFILTGDFGVGKTLIVQRIFQNAVKAALENPNAQIPVYLHTDTWRQDKLLRAIIENEADTLGDIKTQGAVIIIDELDKAPANEAFEIVRQSYLLTEIWQKTTIIFTSRPIQDIERIYKDNLIQIPPLSFEQAHHLIESISDQEVNPMRLRDLGASVEEVITYPLFALLLGRYWREGESRPISTRAELLSNLVDDSLLQAGKSHDIYKQYLIKLAIRCIEFGNKAVPLADIDLSKFEQQALLDSRLVVRQSGGITFPLSIFTQWFAYLALEENPSQIEKYLQDPEQLENWRYALIVAIGNSSSQTIISKILTPIVEKHPSFAVEIIQSSLSNSLSSQRLPLPPVQECGEQLRTLMSAWVKGIGSLARLVAPIREDRTLCPVGVKIRHDNFLESGWYLGNEKLADIQKLPDDNYITRSTWGNFQGRRPSHQSAWAWLWNLNTLRAALASEISTATIPVNQGVISSEASWRASLAIFQNWQVRRLINPNLPKPQKISVKFLTEAMLQIDDELRQNHYRQLPEIHSICNKEQDFCLNCLRQEIKLMQANNISDFSVSYTDVDIAYKRMRWNSDPEKINELKTRVEEIYKAALDEYQNLSKLWFENLLSGMQIAGLLPARLVGIFTPPLLPDNPYGDSPRFYWYLEPLSKDSKNIVDIKFSEEVRNNAYETYCKPLSIIASRLRDLRPNSSSWLRCNPHGSSIDISLFRSDAPVTVLVYSWLKEDLRSIGWIDSHIQHRSKLFR